MCYYSSMSKFNKNKNRVDKTGRRVIHVPNLSELFKDYHGKHELTDEDREWDEMKPVGHELGSDDNPWDDSDDTIK